MKKTFILIFLFFIFSLFLDAKDVLAVADHYVNSKNCSDENLGTSWKDAVCDLNDFTKVINGKTEKALTRGDTYYIADGTYGSYTFDDAIDGEKYIYIKKAITTVDGHGTNVGWLDIYGDGVAEFSSLTFLSILSFTSSYWDIDGQVNYGIKLNRSDTRDPNVYTFNIDGNTRPGINHINLKHIEMAGPGGSTYYDYVGGIRGLYIPGTSSDITVSNCSIHGFSVLIKAVTTDNFLVEYTKLFDNLKIHNNYDAAVHPDVMYVGGGSDNGTFRYNTVYNYSPEGVYFAGPPAGPVMDGWYIYGNVFYNDLTSVPKTSYARAIELKLQVYDPPGGIRNLKIYNNTFVNLNYTMTLVGDGNIKEGGEFKNNLRYNSGNIPTDANLTVQGDLVNPSSSIFNDFADFDFTLSEATANGISLSSPYNIDPTGRTRGADGNWDVGAYEYTGATIPDPVPPSNPTGLLVR